MADVTSEQRSKRQRVDKGGRFAALQKLKGLKGQKNKYTVEEEVNNVYDIVDEAEFTRRVNKFGGNWIEEDGTGYVEDGRDIFEHDEYYSGEEDSHNDKDRKGKKRPREEDQQAKNKGSIKHLLSSAAVKRKKEAPVKIDEDDILADVLGELDTGNEKSGATTVVGATNRDSTKSSKSDDAVVKEYMKSFMNSMKKKDEPKNRPSDTTDDDILDRVVKEQDERKSIVARNAIVAPPITTEVVAKPEPATKAAKVNDASQDRHEKQPPNSIDKQTTGACEYAESMDFSVLDDDDNQFALETPKPSENATCAKTVDPPKQITPKKIPSPTIADHKHLLDNWESICNMVNFDDEMAVETSDDHELGNGVLKMWYWDAWEDSVKRPGQVFLFGKIGNAKENKSVCVQIENVDRCLYLLPREKIWDAKTGRETEQTCKLLDVYNEFNDVISVELGLTTFKSRIVKKNFAFQAPGVNIPQTCDYLEVRYEGKFSTPNVKKAYSSIAHIFGTNTPSLETFLLECKIKGPCWLNIKNFTENKCPLSWCKLEVVCANLNKISVADDQKTALPPLVLLTTNVRSTLNPKTMKNEVVMISCLVNNRFCVDKPPPNPPFNRHFCGLTRPQTQAWPLDVNQKLGQYKSTKTTKLDSERALLSWFLATYQNIDPDLIVTHDANDCQLDIICDRLAALKIPNWSRLGRLRQSQIAGKKFKDFFTGRLICDVKQSAEELIKSRSYDLDTLCMNILKLKEEDRMDVSNDELYSMFESGESITKLITLTMQDCSYILRIMCEMNVIPLALQITNICGNLMSRTLQGGRSERNEYLLLHAFVDKQYIVPDKRLRETAWGDQNDAVAQINHTSSTRKKAAYSGGLVLEPIKGFYDKLILLMDFNSLYPSIIQEYNICFTTVNPPEKEEDMPPLPDENVEQGVLPRQIRRLVESRREVKKLMSNADLDADLKMQYNIRQLALKLTANSMYGCLGFSQSRFFAQHLAALVTFKGREILTNTKSLVQKLNYEVIYGDTDSIMINTNSVDYDQVFKIGHSIKQNVNKIYKQIELDIDGVFKYLLLLKKKKYAAVTMSKNKQGEIELKQEHKGLDIVRRDWSQIAVMAGKTVLDEILSDNQLDEKIENVHARLEKFKEEIVSGSVPLPLLTITKQLTKSPKDYTSVTSFPHVQVALRMNSTKNKRYKKGDMVSYIICEDGTNNPPMQRAYHLDELRTDEKLKVDTMYYLAQQVHPVVSRLCEPLEGTDASRIASCLGLDPSKYRAAAQRNHRERMEDSDGMAIAKSIVEKYRHCEKFKFICAGCKTENIVASAFKPLGTKHIATLEKCTNAECSSLPYEHLPSIRNELALSLRRHVRRFYDNWMVCDDPSCNANTRIYSHVMNNNRPVCVVCKQGNLVRQYSERELFMQLSYFQYVFDLSKNEQKSINLSVELEGAYNILKETVDQLLESSAFCNISLSKLFSSLNVSKAVPLLPTKVVKY